MGGDPFAAPVLPVGLNAPVGVVALGQDPIWQRLGEGTEDGAGKELAEAVAGGHRRRRQGVQNTARRCSDRDRSETPCIVGELGHEHRQNREEAIGVGVIEDDVDAVAALGGGAVVADPHPPVGDGHLHPDLDRLVEAVSHQTVPVDPLWARGDRLTDTLLRPGQYLLC